MKSDEVFELVDSRGPMPMLMPQAIVDAIKRCLTARQLHTLGTVAYSEVEIAELNLARAVIDRAILAGVQACQ